MMTVSVIIVSVGAKDYLRFCLDSLLAQSQLPLEIIVIDNSLRPDFSRRLSLDYPAVKFYPSRENLYYTGALNKGINLSRGEVVLCLNDDVILDRDFIKEAMAAFLVSDKIGSVSGKILRSDKKTLDSTGLFLSIWRTAKERGYGQIDRGQFEQKSFIFGSSGAAAFYRRKMLDKVRQGADYFDENFRMFYEDLDIAWRAQKNSWRAYYVPSARIYHVRGGSFRPESGIGRPIARQYLTDQLHADLIKNRYLTILKNENFYGFLLHLVPVLIYDICAWIYVLLFRPAVVKVLFGYFFRGAAAAGKKQPTVLEKDLTN